MIIFLYNYLSQQYQVTTHAYHFFVRLASYYNIQGDFESSADNLTCDKTP
jgi:hypothetical protein